MVYYTYNDISNHLASPATIIIFVKLVTHKQ